MIFLNDRFYLISYTLFNQNHSLKNRELHIKYAIEDIDPVNDPVFKLLQKDKNITLTQLSKILNISLSTVKRKIKALKTKGKIQRIGSDKTGFWQIN